MPPTPFIANAASAEPDPRLARGCDSSVTLRGKDREPTAIIRLSTHGILTLYQDSTPTASESTRKGVAAVSRDSCCLSVAADSLYSRYVLM